MSPADIAAANRRLAGAESFTIAPSKYLGHYVAGNLAARHDITVHLHSSPGTGITATVELPADLLTADPGTVAAPVTPRRGQRSLAAPAPAPAAMSPTPGGLVPRAPRQPGVAPAGPIRAPASQTDAHLASLARAAARAPAGQHPAAPAGPARAAPGGPWPGGQPFGRAGAGTGTPWPPPHTGPGVGAPPPLTRRDRGAQMPVTTPHSVRRTPPAGAALGGPSPSHPPRAALEIYGFLASFTAGVQRGLAATRTVHRDEPGR